MAFLWILACLLLCSTVSASIENHRFKQLEYDLLKRAMERECRQETPNCADCLSSRSCTWCTSELGAKCASVLQCPKESSINTCNELKPVLDARSQDIDAFLRKLDSSPSKEGCKERGNCSFCTSSPSCSWCEKTRRCFPFDSSSNATSRCGSTLWYRNQCTYSSTITPCPQRTGGCKECTKDKLCFFCKSSGNCSYYPYDAYVPKDCPAGETYYKECSHMSFWVVLSPILAIILAPILIFIILAIVLWCMKKVCKKGDDAEEEEEDSSSDESPLPEKKDKMLMSHKPEPSRVEELRKKYNLGK